MNDPSGTKGRNSEPRAGALAANLCREPGPESMTPGVPPAASGGRMEPRWCHLPWPGQLSPDLARSLLLNRVSPGSTVLDPFMGRGTVLIEATRMGLAAYGCEIHPAAFLPGRLCEMSRLHPGQRLHLLEQALSLPELRRFAAACNGKLFSPAGHVPPWYVPGVNGSEPDTASPSGIHGILSPAGACPLRPGPDPDLHLLAPALLVLMDEVAENRKRQAGRWEEILRLLENMSWTGAPVQTFLRDARHIPLPDRSVDLVLTAFPGLGGGGACSGSHAVIKQMGWDIRGALRSGIGSTRRFRQNPFFSVLQYCMDIALVLNELQRLCHSRSRLLLVVRHQSIIRRAPFFNATIVGRIATGITGMTVQRTQKRAVRNRCGRHDQEDLLHLLPGGSYQPDTSGIVERARAIGQDILVRTLPYAPLSSRILLEQALLQAGDVQPSPRLDPDRIWKKTGGAPENTSSKNASSFSSSFSGDIVPVETGEQWYDVCPGNPASF